MQKLSVEPSFRTGTQRLPSPSAGLAPPNPPPQASLRFLPCPLGLGEVVRSAGGKEEVESSREAEVGSCHGPFWAFPSQSHTLPSLCRISDTHKPHLRASPVAQEAFTEGKKRCHIPMSLGEVTHQLLRHEQLILLRQRMMRKERACVGSSMGHKEDNTVTSQFSHR